MISGALAPSAAIAALYSGLSVSARGGGLRPSDVRRARHVAELEARDAQARRRQRLGRRGHRRRIHRRAGAVRQQDGDACILGAVEQEFHVALWVC